MPLEEKTPRHPEPRYVKVLKAFTEFDAFHREDILEKTLGLMKNPGWGFYPAQIVRALGKIIPKDRTDVIEKSLKAMEGIGTKYRLKLYQLLTAMSKVEPGQREEVLQMAQLFLKKGDEGLYNTRIITAIVNIDPADRKDVVNIAQSFIEKTNSYNYVNLIKIMNLIPRAHRTPEISQTIFSLFDQGNNFLDIMEGIDPAERMDVLEKTLPLMEDNKPSPVKYQHTHLMSAFSLIPASERSNASECLFDS
jgi:hypothetical protein